MDDILKRMLEDQQSRAERARRDGNLEGVASLEVSIESIRKTLNKLKSEDDSSD